MTTTRRGSIEDTIAMHDSGFPIVLLVTFEEADAEAAIGQAARSRQIAVKRFPTGDDPLAAVNAARVVEGPAIVILEDMHRHWSSPAIVRALRDMVPFLPGRKVTIVLVSPVPDLPPELIHDVARIDVPLPDAAAMTAIVAARFHAAPEAGRTADVARALLGLTGNEAGRLLAKIGESGVRGLPDPAVVLAEKTRLVRAASALDIVDPAATVDDLGGAGELKRWLAERTRAFGEEARRFGLPEPRGVLLAGVQGCGKSLAARTIASYWSLPLARLDMGLLMGLPAPAAALHDALKVMEAMCPAVLWIDEIEKVLQAGSRGEAGRILGMFVTWLSEKRSPVFTVATANEVDLLPPELVRKGRFDEIFFFDLPDGHDRSDIFRIHLARRRSESGEIDPEHLSAITEHFSGSEIEQVVIAALYRAFAAGRAVEGADLQVAINETVPLYRTYEERIKALREWAKGRARPAALARKRLDMFEKA